jgi:hypothetical protein
MLLKANNPVLNAIVLYLLIVFIILYIKPAIFYDNEGNLKNYGLDTINNKTLFPLPIMLGLLAVLTYLFTLILSSTKELI